MGEGGRNCKESVRKLSSRLGGAVQPGTQCHKQVRGTMLIMTWLVRLYIEWLLRGSRTVKVLPCPGALSTSISP
jgi:hypothetical protein